MKTIITALLAVFMLAGTQANATNNFIGNDPNNADTVSNTEPITHSEDMAQFPGGELELEKFVQKNVQYPRIAKEQGIEGRVIVALVIDENGAITDVELIQSIGGGCDEEVIRVLSEMPVWKPTKQDGKNVKAQKIFSFNFQL
jgi:protein TonB